MTLRHYRFCAAALLLLALLPWPYAYYQLLRWACCAVFAFSAHAEWKHPRRAWPLVILAVLFNPLAPIHLTRPVWAVLDIIAAGFAAIPVLRTPPPEGAT